MITIWPARAQLVAVGRQRSSRASAAPSASGASIANELAAAGWDIAFTYWAAYDKRMPWGAEAGAADAIERSLICRGADG